MPGGEIIFYAFIAMIVLGVLGILFSLSSLAWAFGESTFAKFAYIFSLVLIVLANVWLLLTSGLQGWAVNWRVMPTGTALFALLTIWIIAGVPLVRWAKHRVSAAEEAGHLSSVAKGSIVLLGLGVLVVVLVVIFSSVADRSNTTISGRVVDDEGRPVQGIEVGLMYENFDTGGAHVKETNSEGGYRLDPVRPGTYYLTARPVPPYISDATYQPAGTVVPEEMAAQGLEYLFTFYPNATAAEGARKVVINQGDDLIEMDIVVPRVRSPSVAGVVLLPSGEPASSGRVTLFGDEGGYRSSGGAVGDDGTFEFPAVRPGRYMMKIATRYAGFEDQDCAYLPITVEDEDIEGLVLASAPIARIRGRVTGPDFLNMRSSPEVRAYPDGVISTQVSPNAGAVRIDGTFTTAGACGTTRLFVDGLPEGWYVESMRLGERDITDQAVDFGRTASGQQVEIVLASGAPVLTVELVDAHTGARRRGKVVVLPDDSSLWTYGSRFLAASSATGQQAAVIHGLPPGDYLVAAISGASRGIRRFTALQYLSGVATPVHLEHGDATTLTLEVQ